MRMGLGVKGEKKAAMAPWQRMWHKKSKAKTVATDEQKAGIFTIRLPDGSKPRAHSIIVDSKAFFLFSFLLLLVEEGGTVAARVLPPIYWRSWIAN